MDEENEAPAVDGNTQTFTVQQDRYKVFPDGQPVAAQLQLKVTAQGLCFMHDDGETLINVLPMSRLAGWQVGSDGSVLEIALKTIYVQLRQRRTVAIEYDETAVVETILRAVCEKEDLSSDDFQLMFGGLWAR